MRVALHVLWLRLECLSKLISDSLSQVYLIKIFHFLEFSDLATACVN